MKESIKNLYDYYGVEYDNNLKVIRDTPDVTEFVEDDENTNMSSTSRYLNIDKVINEDNIYYTTYKNYVIPKSDDDVYHKVEISNQDRLDIIANIYYNNPTYWWVIAIANNIKNPFYIPKDTILRIPNIMTLYNEGSVLE